MTNPERRSCHGRTSFPLSIDTLRQVDNSPDHPASCTPVLDIHMVIRIDLKCHHTVQVSRVQLCHTAIRPMSRASAIKPVKPRAFRFINYAKITLAVHIQLSGILSHFLQVRFYDIHCTLCRTALKFQFNNSGNIRHSVRESPTRGEVHLHDCHIRPVSQLWYVELRIDE